MDREQKLYKLIEQNETEEAIEILQLPDLKLRRYGCQGDDERRKCCSNWSMLQWACYHGNEQVNRLIVK